LPLGKQNRSRGITGGKGFLFQGIDYGWGKIAKRLICWRRSLGMIYDLCGHELPPVTAILASA
jgi:hypothetical protein